MVSPWGIWGGNFIMCWTKTVVFVLVIGFFGNYIKAYLVYKEHMDYTSYLYIPPLPTPKIYTPYIELASFKPVYNKIFILK